MTIIDTPLDFTTLMAIPVRTFTRPQIVAEGDTARTPRDGAWSEHLAADRSQGSLTAVKAAVLQMITQEGPLGGTDLNRLYGIRRERYRWPIVHFDTPRKRARDLVSDGFLVITNLDEPRGTEHEYALAVAS